MSGTIWLMIFQWVIVAILALLAVKSRRAVRRIQKIEAEMQASALRLELELNQWMARNREQEEG